MAKVTWLGSPGGPEQGDFAGKVFPKGEAVEVADDWGPLAKVAKNKFFKVEGYDEASAKHDEPLAHRPPSEQSAQGPVPKGGEPIMPERLQMPVADKAEPEAPKAQEEHHPAVQAAMRPHRRS